MAILIHNNLFYICFGIGYFDIVISCIVRVSEPHSLLWPVREYALSANVGTRTGPPSGSAITKKEENQNEKAQTVFLARARDCQHFRNSASPADFPSKPPGRSDPHLPAGMPEAQTTKGI